MEYLPQPSRAFSHVRVPFVAQIDFDGQDFATFPHRSGFGKDLSSSSGEELASLVQSWLYFGTLDTFLGVKVIKDDFRTKYPDGDYVNAEPVLGLLSKWLARAILPILGPDVVKDTTSSVAEELLKHVTTMTEFLEDVIKHADALETLPQASTGALPAVLLSVRVLAATLSGVLDESVCQSDFGFLDNKYEPGRIERQRFISALPDQPRRASAACLVEDMIAKGWCPYMARKLCLNYNYVVVYYLSRLRGYDDVSHARCSENACIAHNVDMSNYRTKHTTKDCDCAHVHVDRDQIHSIISNGGIPVISFKKVAGQTELEVRKMTHKTSYVAFSHVWSDGLGNATSNSLPRCQIEKLARDLEELEPPKMAMQQAVVNLGPMRMDLQRMTRDLQISHFWLDTLCIPVGEEYMDLKLRAINSMAAIYAGALQVLVLDSSLEQLSLRSADVDVCEMLGRVSTSPWMGRSWTFQEAAISNIRQIRCLEASFNPTGVRFGHPTAFTRVFDANSLSEWLPSFADILVALGRMFRRTETDQHLARRLITYMSPDIKVPLVALITRPLKDTMIKEFLGSKLMEVEYDLPYQRFVACWNALCSRTTTKREDVHLIFANILGFSATTVWEISNPCERMAALLFSLPSIPLSLFFSSTSVRDRPGESHYNRWMPLFPSGEPCELFPQVSVSECRLRLSSKALSVDEDGDEESEDESKAPSKPWAFRITSRLPGVGNQDIVLEGVSEDRRFAIAFHRAQNDGFASTLCEGESVLVFDTDLTKEALVSEQSMGGGITFRGALFQVVGEGPAAGDAKLEDSADGVQQYRVAFDCPVSATFVVGDGGGLEESSLQQGGVIRASLLAEPWEFDIYRSKFATSPYFSVFWHELIIGC